MSLRVTHLLVQRALYIMGYGNHIQNGSHDCHGVCQSSGFKGETHQSCQSHHCNQSVGRSSTKGGHHLAHPEPH
jgi:hypothetical protein